MTSRQKNYLFQAIDRTVLDTILKKDTNKDIWDAMKKKFEGNERVKIERSHLQALRREFETLEMRTSEGVTEYFSRVMIVANKMRIMARICRMSKWWRKFCAL